LLGAAEKPGLFSSVIAFTQSDAPPLMIAAEEPKPLPSV